MSGNFLYKHAEKLISNLSDTIPISRGLLTIGLFAIVQGTSTRATDGNAIGGTGDVAPYILRTTAVDKVPFDKEKNYVRIDAVSWFVNKQGSCMKSVIASGTVALKVDESPYSFPLGSFTLEKGAKSSPIFEMPLIPTTPWDGSPISIFANLTAMKNNTKFGSLLQSLAVAAVNYGSMAMDSSSLLTAYPGLSQISATLTGTAEEIVQQQGIGKVPIFDNESGAGITIQSENLYGNETYILLYKGRPLVQSNLRIEVGGLTGIPEVVENGKPLRDGAWILFRIAREDYFAGARPWSGDLERAKAQLKVQMTIFKSDPTAGKSILNALQLTSDHGGGKPQTLGDQFNFIGNLIGQDMALTPNQRLQELTIANLYPVIAEKAIQKANPDDFFKNIAILENGANGTNIPQATVTTVFRMATDQAMSLKQNWGTNFNGLVVNRDFVARTVDLQAVKAELRAEQEAWEHAMAMEPKIDPYIPQNDPYFNLFHKGQIDWPSS